MPETMDKATKFVLEHEYYLKTHLEKANSRVFLK